MRRSAFLFMLLLAACAAPKPTTKPTTAALETAAPQGAGSAFVGRWIFSPGDSALPEDAATAPADKDAGSGADAKKSSAVAEAAARGTSPAGAVLSLGEGGVMFAREGDFIRRGLWKHDGVTLRLIVEPPPRRLEMGFAPAIEGDRLTLTGAAGMVLVYHRDPFVAAGRVP